MIVRGIREMTITPLDADGNPTGESKTLDLKSTIKVHPRANPITAYLTTLEIH